MEEISGFAAVPPLQLNQVSGSRRRRARAGSAGKQSTVKKGRFSPSRAGVIRRVQSTREAAKYYGHRKKRDVNERDVLSARHRVFAQRGANTKRISTLVATVLHSREGYVDLQEEIARSKLSDDALRAILEENIAKASRKTLKDYLRAEEDELSEVFTRRRGHSFDWRSELRQCSQSALLHEKRLKKRYKNAASLFGGTMEENRRVQTAMLQFLQTLRDECTSSMPVVQMLVAIHEIDQCKNSRERKAMSQECFETFLDVSSELVSGRVATHGVYALIGSEDYEVSVKQARSRFDESKVSCELLRALKEPALAHLDALYFADGGARARFRFNDSDQFRALLQSPKEEPPPASCKVGGDRSGVRSILCKGSDVSPPPRREEDESLRDAVAARFCPQWSVRKPLLHQADYTKAKARQVVAAYLAEDPSFHYALQRLDQARRALILRVRRSEGGARTMTVLNALESLLALPRAGALEIDEFIRRLDAIDSKTHAILSKHSLDSSLIRKLRHLASPSNRRRLELRAELFIQDRLCCWTASKLLACSEQSEGVRFRKTRRTLDRLLELMSQSGDLKAMRSLEFLREVQKFRANPLKHRAKAIFMQYLALYEEFDTGRPCASGLYHLRTNGLPRLVQNARAQNPQAEISLVAIYQLAYHHLCDSWFSDNPPIELAKAGFDTYKRIPRSKDRKRQTARLRHLLRGLGAAPEVVLWHAAVDERVSFYIVPTSHVSDLEDVDAFIAAKVSQVESHLLVETGAWLRDLCTRIHGVERLLQQDCAARGARSRASDALLHWLEQVGDAIADQHQGDVLDSARRVKKAINNLRARRDIHQDHKQALIDHLFSPSLWRSLRSMASKSSKRRLRKHLENQIGKTLSYLCVRESLMNPGKMNVFQKQSLKLWERFLAAQGDVEAIHMTRFLLQVGKPQALSLDDMKRLHEVYLDVEGEGSGGKEKELRRGLYFLWRRPELTEMVKKPSREHFAGLQSVVTEALLERYPEGCMRSLVSEPLPRLALDRITKISEKRAPMQLAELQRLLASNHLSSQDWQRRVYEVVLAHFAVPDSCSASMLVEQKKAQIIRNILQLRLGLDTAIDQRLKHSLCLASSFLSQQEGLTPPVIARYNALMDLVPKNESGQRGFRANRLSSSDPKICVDLVGENALQGLDLLTDSRELEGPVTRILSDLIDVEVIRSRPHYYTFSAKRLRKLEKLISRVKISECTRTYIQHGDFNPSSITVRTTEGKLSWRIDEAGLKQLFQAEGCRNSGDRIALFYRELFLAFERSASFYKGRDEPGLPVFLSRSEIELDRGRRPKALAELRGVVPWIDPLLAGTNGPWAVVHMFLMEKYPESFEWTGKLTSGPDKAERTHLTFHVDNDKEKVIVEVNRAQATDLKAREGALLKFRVIARYTFDKVGHLTAASVEVRDHRLAEGWLDLNLTSSLVKEHLRRSS